MSAMRIVQIAYLLCVIVAPMGWAQELTVLTSFPGDCGPGPKDNPDNTGGVGPSHVVDCTDANIVIHDKTTGKVLKRMTQTEFWKNAKPGFTPNAARPPNAAPLVTYRRCERVRL